MPVELKPGSASAQAHAEAAAASRAPGGAGEALRKMAGGGDEPAPAAPAAPAADPEDEPAPAAPGEGTSPEPATPADPAAPKDDDEDISDDYDEEEVAEPGAPEDEPSPQPATAATDPDKTWGQYKTEDERKKALHENKAYGIKMAAKAKQLEEENALLKAGKPTEAAPAPKDPAAPPPQPETVETVLRRLMETDPNVASAVQTLQTQREAIVGRTQQLGELKKSVTETEARGERAAHVLEYLEERLKAEPDNFELVEIIKAKKSEINALETSVNSQTIKMHRLEDEVMRDQSRYREGLANVREHATTAASASEAKAKADETFKQNYEKANKEWDAALPKVFEKFKIANPKIQKRINTMLLRAAAVESDDIDNIEGWMLQQGSEIHEVLEEARADAIKGYKGAKNTDAHQPAPDGNAAVATPERRVPRSSREADRIAAKQLKESLGARR